MSVPRPVSERVNLHANSCITAHALNLKFARKHGDGVALRWTRCNLAAAGLGVMAGPGRPIPGMNKVDVL